MRRIAGFILQAIGLLTVITLILGLGLLTFAGYWMRVSDAPFRADYIVPLAGDEHRIIKGAELYNAGYAPAILISNAVELPPSRYDQLRWKLGYPKHTRAQMETMMLRYLGAESARLESFGDGHISTAEEIEALKAHLNGKTPKLLVVTSPYHARRAKLIIERILPDCPARVVVTDEGEFRKAWWTDQDSARYLVMEMAKTAYFLVGGVFRSSD